MLRKKDSVKAVCTTQDFPIRDAGKLDIWFDHLISVGRACAVVKRMYRGKWGCSVWRLIDESELDHYENLDMLDQLSGNFEIAKEHGGFGEGL